MSMAFAVGLQYGFRLADSIFPMHRREFSKSLLACLPVANAAAAPSRLPVEVNDVHSQLNATKVAGVEPVTSLSGLQDAIRSARRQ